MVKKVTTTIRPNLKKVPPDQRARVAERIGEFVVDKINERSGNSLSSVARQGRFEKLSDKYKKIKKNITGHKRADLKLKNKMLPEVEHLIKKGNAVEIGVFDDSNDNVQKADNHNKRSAKSKRTKVPRRAFIPNKGEEFTRDITSGIKRIIKDASIDDDQV